jgi:predicted ATPase
MSELPRGTVTFLFTDIEGSTKLLDELGPESYRDALGEHRRLLRETFARHGGYEVDYEGDAFFVAFERAGEAVAAAQEGQAALAGGPIRVRMGLHTGEPIIDPPKYVGRDVHLAARVMSAGHGGQVLVSRATHELVDGVEVHDLGDHRLKDVAEPVRLFQVGGGEFPPLKTISNTNLPVPASSFLGRRAELAEAEQLLPSTRLLTVTGPGGTGKTRFAIELAAAQLDRFPNGIFWVPLAALRDGALVLETVGQALGARGAVAEHIGDKRMLLVLDNFEQVIEAAPDVSDLLAACPNVCLLVTSRELLRIAGEFEYPLPPLESHEGASLFCDRARVERTSAVDELCRRLDNLPLAIELAAARATMLSPEQLLERLGGRLDLLRGGRDTDARQRTLRATMEWSYDLLQPEEQALMARLSVFPGGCTLEAAEAVSAAGLDALQSLIDKSLVRRTEGRFWMLETVREFAGEKLGECGEEASQKRRHVDWFLQLAEETAFQARGTDREACFDVLEADHDNLRAAFGMAEALEDSDAELRLATALWEFWVARGHLIEGGRLLDGALERSPAQPVRARLGRCALGATLGAPFAELLAEAEEVAGTAEHEGDRYTHVQALIVIASAKLALQRFGEAEEPLHQALGISAGDFPALEGQAVGWLLISALYGPLPADRGIARCREAYERAGENRTVQAFALVERSALEAMRGEFETARRLLGEGREVFRELDLNVYGANTAQEAYFIEMLAGDPAAAIADLGAAYELLEEMGERGFLSTIAGYLAHACHAAGDLEAAKRSADLSAAAASVDDFLSHSLWRSARAKILACEGDTEGALRYAQEALDLFLGIDAPNTLAERFADLAYVLGRAGRPVEETSALEQALSLFEQKGNLVASERTRTALGSLRVGP